MNRQSPDDTQGRRDLPTTSQPPQKQLPPCQEGSAPANPAASNDDDESTKSLKKEILGEYKAVKKAYDRMVSTDGYDSFTLNLSDQPPPKDDICALPKFSKSTNKKVFAKFQSSRRNDVIPKLSVTLLDKAEKIPSMTTWININKNISGKDKLGLDNFPYFGDAVTEDEILLEEGILALFPEGVHGANKRSHKYMNNWMLYRICGPILERHKWESDEDIERLMTQMRELFPLKGSLKDFISSYYSSLRFFEPQKVFVRPRVTDDEGKFVGHLPPTTVVDTFARLMCKRCFSFDCIFHQITEDDVHVECDEKPIDVVKEACGPDCYKSILKPSAEVYGNNNAEWNDNEKTWFDALQVSGISDSCRISQLFTHVYQNCDKTCKQIHEYAKSKTPLPRTSFDSNAIENNDRKLPVVTKKDLNKFRSLHRGKLNKARPFESCLHPGKCTAENGCSCKENNIVCTKYCGCPTTCTSRIPGCICKPGNCGSTQCDCYLAGWECDPDLCRSCNCGGNGKDGELICKNTNLQRCLMRKLYLNHSTVAGTGCFTEDFIPKSAYIGEYTGEVISHDEGERRGKVYDAQKRSYIFKLNDEQCLDAARYGNLLRFLNHSDTPNTRPKTLVVNGEHRIGFFAICNIEADEELFFNYNYTRDSKARYSFQDSPQ